MSVCILGTLAVFGLHGIYEDRAICGRDNVCLLSPYRLISKRLANLVGAVIQFQKPLPQP